MKKKNIPAIIMLSAGAITSIFCIINKYSFMVTLKLTLIILIVFYIIGTIAGKIIYKVNQDANDAYIFRKREEMKKEQDELVITEEEEAAAVEPTDSEPAEEK